MAVLGPSAARGAGRGGFDAATPGQLAPLARPLRQRHGPARRAARDLGRLNTRLGWGEAVTPVVHGDSLLLNCDQEADSALVCLDARTGRTKWKADRDEKTSWNTPLVVEHRGRYQVIVNATRRVRG